MDFLQAYERISNFVPFTPIQNISGAPAITLPMGMSKEGLPIGVQFSGAYGQDKLILELSIEIERAFKWKTITKK